jgi:hypothetical protein
MDMSSHQSMNSVGLLPIAPLERLGNSLQGHGAADLPEFATSLVRASGGSLAISIPATRRARGGFPDLILPRRSMRSVPSLPDQKRFPVGSLDFSRTESRLPFGVPRYVNAATLKRIAGGRPSDTLLRLVGKAWEFVSDQVMVDLDDVKQQFKLGAVQIIS